MCDLRDLLLRLAKTPGNKIKILTENKMSDEAGSHTENSYAQEFELQIAV